MFAAIDSLSSTDRRMPAFQRRLHATDPNDSAINEHLRVFGTATGRYAISFCLKVATVRFK